MKQVFVSMDYGHDERLIKYMNFWKRDDTLEFVHVNVRRLSAKGVKTDSLKEQIRNAIDSTDAMLVFAGEWSNDAEVIKKRGGALYTAEEIGALNWQHYGLRYARKQKKAMRGVKLFPECDIPLAVRTLRGLHWRVLRLSKDFKNAVAEMFPSE